jgi:hypothetical protein
MRVARSHVGPPPGPMVKDQEKGVLCTEVGGLVACELALAQDAKPDLQRHLKLVDLAVLDEPTCLSDLVPGQAFKALRCLGYGATYCIIRGDLGDSHEFDEFIGLTDIIHDGLPMARIP